VDIGFIFEAESFHRQETKDPDLAFALAASTTAASNYQTGSAIQPMVFLGLFYYHCLRIGSSYNTMVSI
jgi:hypothetical protein